jgi:hypothetical protein
MQITTGAGYQSTKFAKLMAVGENKLGKTCFTVAGALGVLPWQKNGGVVDSPKSLHVVTFDSNALGGIQSFLKSCGAPDAALDFNVYNLQDDFRRVSENEKDYDPTFYSAIFQALEAVDKAVKDSTTSMLVFSSLTGAAAGIQRGIAGPPGHDGKQVRSTMDQNKWSMLGQQLVELQNWGQRDRWHCIWEAHLDRANTGAKDDRGQPVEKDIIRVQGSAGKNWGYNVEQIVRIRRQFGRTHPGTKLDLTSFDTRPNFDFVAGGRNFTEKLSPSEPDMTEMFTKLGLKTGNWKMK